MCFSSLTSLCLPLKEGSDITALWQSSLSNANIEVQRYMIDISHAIFMVCKFWWLIPINEYRNHHRVFFIFFSLHQLKDGTNALAVKDFLIKQDRCNEVTIDQQSWKGLGYQGAQKTELWHDRVISTELRLPIRVVVMSLSLQIALHAKMAPKYTVLGC